ncbi:hypothetical protein [Ureaplasma ceti]|uniref:Restriction endonuclease subunit S n=1 Tax=Ureaplasma ceti TaxID=3119530 RepID=A0ABP9UBE9_9BACT
MSNKKIPNIRFKHFTEEWSNHQLSDFFTKYQETVYLEDNKIYKQISVRNTGLIEHRCVNEGKNIGRKRQYLINLDKYPVTLTFTRQTIYEGGIGFIPKHLNKYIVTENMPLLSKNNNLDQNFFTSLLLNHNYFYKAIELNTPIGSAQKALHEKIWLKTNLLFPDIKEQSKIGAFMSLISNLIALYKKKCEKLEKIKSTLIKTLLDSSDSIFVKNEKYSFDRRLINEVISVIPFKKFICNKLDLNGSFPVIQQGDNPLIGYSNQMPYMKYEDVIVFGDHTLSLYKPTSPFLVATDGVKIIKNNDSYICKEFLIYLLINNLPKSEGYKRHFQLLNGKEVNVITSKNIQKILSNLFFSMDKSIALCKRKCEKLENIKKSLLEKMFI